MQQGHCVLEATLRYRVARDGKNDMTEVIVLS